MSFVTDFPQAGPTRSHAAARMIDISAVQAQHGEQDVRSLAQSAREGDYIAAHVLPSWVPLLSELLAGSNTRVGSPVGFPSGGTATDIKCAEAEWLVGAGVQEMDIVANIGLIKSGRYEDVTNDIRLVLEVVQDRVPTKVILEVGHLENDQLEHAAEAALAAGATSLKTGTGWSGIPTTPEHVARIRAVAGPDVEIKASGGVRSFTDLVSLYEAGARRFGANTASATVITAEAGRA